MRLIDQVVATMAAAVATFTVEAFETVDVVLPATLILCTGGSTEDLVGQPYQSDPWCSDCGPMTLGTEFDILGTKAFGNIQVNQPEFPGSDSSCGCCATFRSSMFLDEGLWER